MEDLNRSVRQLSSRENDQYVGKVGKFVKCKLNGCVLVRAFLKAKGMGVAVWWKNFCQLARSQRQWYPARGYATAGVTPVILPIGWWLSPMGK